MWAVWRVVFRKVATLEEIETHWSIVDLDKANEILDYLDALDAKKTPPTKPGRR